VTKYLIRNFKKEGFILTISGWLALRCVWVLIRQNIMTRVCSKGKMFTSWQPESRESDRKGPGTRYSLQKAYSQ
jgi:hypothetical protein